TPLLFRALQRLGVPTLMFVNKIDRVGADPEAVVAAMSRRLSPAVVPMERVRGAGARRATVEPFAATDPGHGTAPTEVLADPRQRVRVGGGAEAKATAIQVFAPKGSPRRDVVRAGEMATIRGLGAVRVGDALGDAPPGEDVVARFPRPALEAIVFALRPEQQGSLRAALGQLAEQDPLIDVRQDDRQQIAVSLYGEVQKEVIQATLERDYGITADFR